MGQGHTKSPVVHKGGKPKTSSGSGSDGPKKGARDNSVMQQKLADTPGNGLDEGMNGLFTEFEDRQKEYGGVFGQASGLVQKAHSAQDTGDLPGRSAAVDALVDEKTSILWQLDWFLPGYGITRDLSYIIDDQPQLVQVPAFVDGVHKVASFAETVKAQRALLIPFLIPRTVHGKNIPAIQGIPMGDASFTELLEGQEQLLEPLFTIAGDLRAMLAGASSLTGPAAAALATDVAAGPMADFAPESGEFEYLYTVVQNSKASPEVKARVDWLLGRDDFSVYEGLYGMAAIPGMLMDAKNAVTAGNKPAPTPVGPMSVPGDDPFGLDADEDGICYAPGMAPKKLDLSKPFGMSMGGPAVKPVNPQDHIKPGAVATSAASKTAKTTGFDTSKIPEGEEEEEEKPKTSNGKPSDRGMGKVQKSTEREGKFVVGNGSVGGDASVKRKVKRRDGSGSEAGGGASLEAGENLGGSVNAAGKKTYKNGSTVGASGEVGRDAEGNWNGKVRVDGSTQDKKGNGVSGGKTIAYDHENGMSMGGDLTNKTKNADGSTTSTTGGISVSTKGNVNVNGGRVREDARGNKVGTTGGGSYNRESGELAGNVKYSRTDKKGEDKGSIGANAAIDMNGEDGKTGMKGGISASKEGKSVSLSGGYSAVVEKPVEVDGRWVVTWVTDLSGQVSAGAKGKKYGASVNAGGSKKKFGKKSFKTEDEAKAFFENPKLDGVPGSADDAAAMAEGDTRSTETGYNVGGDVSATVGMVEVGAGGSHSKSGYQTVTKGEGGKVKVEIGTKELDEAHGSLGMAGVSGGMGKSWANQESVTVEFDLSTPEGRNAYNHHQRFGALPPRGWRVVGNMKGDAQTTSYSLGILGVKIGSSHTVSHEEETLEGNKYERDAGTDAHSVSVPLLGNYSRSHSLNMLQVNDGRTFYNAESVVKGSDLDDVRSGLARSAMGTEEGSSKGGSNKGTYRLQSAISEADMDRFIAAAVSADAERTFNYEGGLHATDGLDDLQSGLRKAAGDRDAQRRILARWVADEGADALEVLHAISHGKFNQRGEGGTQLYVAIDGDPYMNGMKGQLDLELRVQGWDQRLMQGERGPGLMSEIRKDIIFQREKSKHLETCAELPYRVYNQEYDRIRANIAMLESLLQRSMESDGTNEAAGATLESPKFQAFRRATANLSVARIQCERTLESAYPKYKIEHEGAFSSNGRGRDQDLPHEKAAYAEAYSAYQNGETARQAGLLAESLSNQTLDETSVAPLTAMVTKARSEYLRSARFYKRAIDKWDEIGMRNIGKAYRGFYGERVAPGQ